MFVIAVASLLFQAAAAPPCATPEHRAFDFWIGDWDVFNPQDRQVGTNRIEKILNGCALLEHWTSANGGEGKSLNVYQPSRRKWHQLWMDKTGRAQDYWGEAVEDGILLIDDSGAGWLRMRFTRKGPDEVRQHMELSTDRGKSWKTLFDGTYRRRK